MRRTVGWALVAGAMGCQPTTSPPVDEVVGMVSSPDPRPSRNVIVVLLDDVSPWQVGTFDEHPTPANTPVLSRLAEEGLLFRNFFSMPTCSPTRAAALTGRYGRRYHIGQFFLNQLDWELPLEEITLAEQLKLGPVPYSSHVVGKWHIASLASDNGVSHPLVQGFESYRGFPLNIDGIASYYDYPKVSSDGSFTQSTTYLTTDEVDDAIDLISWVREPFFVWLALHAPHRPYHVPPEELRTLALSPLSDDGHKVLGAIEAIDAELGRILDQIDPEVLANTDLFVLSDNGATAAAAIPPVVALEGKGTLFDGGVRVPMIVVGPDVGRPGTETMAQGHVADLFPTIAAIAGSPISHEIDGRSLLPVLRGDDTVGREFVYVESFYPNGPVDTLDIDERGVRERDWKLIRSPGMPAELYRMDHTLSEGPDYLLGPLDPEAQEAFDRLSAELDRVEGSLGILESP